MRLLEMKNFFLSSHIDHSGTFIVKQKFNENNVYNWPTALAWATIALSPFITSRLFGMICAGGNKKPLDEPRIGRNSKVYANRVLWTPNAQSGLDPLAVSVYLFNGIVREVTFVFSIPTLYGSSHIELIIPQNRRHHKKCRNQPQIY